MLTRRRFLRDLATGLLVAAAPVVALEPERRWWAVPRNAPVPSRAPEWHEFVSSRAIDGRGWWAEGLDSELRSSPHGVTWMVASEPIRAGDLVALDDSGKARPASAHFIVDHDGSIEPVGHTVAAVQPWEAKSADEILADCREARELLQPRVGAKVYQGKVYQGKITVRLNGVELKTYGAAELQLGGSVGARSGPPPIIEPVKFDVTMDVDRGAETVSRTVDRERARREVEEMRERLRARYAEWVERGWIAPQRG